MEKIQHGIAGFFSGAFIGFLIGLIELRVIDKEKHPATLFLVIVPTILICGIIGVSKALSIEKKKRVKK